MPISAEDVDDVDVKSRKKGVELFDVGSIWSERIDAFDAAVNMTDVCTISKVLVGAGAVTVAMTTTVLDPEVEGLGIEGEATVLSVDPAPPGTKGMGPPWLDIGRLALEKDDDATVLGAVVIALETGTEAMGLGVDTTLSEEANEVIVLVSVVAVSEKDADTIGPSAELVESGMGAEVQLVSVDVRELKRNREVIVLSAVSAVSELGADISGINREEKMPLVAEAGSVGELLC